jgi:phage FluMu gp28-like protein
MRRGLNDDDTWNQEFCCIFLKSTGAWLTLDLISACEDAGATIDLPPDFHPRGSLYSGIDVGRDHDATCLWLDEKIGDVAWTRAVIKLHAMSFPEQCKRLNPIVRMTSRSAIDKTGMGVGLFDLLNLENEGRLMGVSFGGSNDDGVKMKTDLAIRIKKRLEQQRSRLPYDLQIRAELQAIKRQATPSGVTFDAPRIEVDTAVAGGVKKKLFAHADAFWAKALADLAGDGGACLLSGVQTPDTPTSYSQMKGYL